MVRHTMRNGTGRTSTRTGKGAAPGLGDISDAAPRWLGPARLAKVDYRPKTGKAAPGLGGGYPAPLQTGLGALGERQTRFDPTRRVSKRCPLALDHGLGSRVSRRRTRARSGLCSAMGP